MIFINRCFFCGIKGAFFSELLKKSFLLHKKFFLKISSLKFKNRPHRSYGYAFGYF